MSDNAMIEVLKAHQPENGHRDLHQHCTCGWFGKAMHRDFLKHQADALEAAGCVQQALIEWGVASKWGMHPRVSKQEAEDYVLFSAKYPDDHARLIKRRAASEPGPWEDA